VRRKEPFRSVAPRAGAKHGFHTLDLPEDLGGLQDLHGRSGRLDRSPADAPGVRLGPFRPASPARGRNLLPGPRIPPAMPVAAGRGRAGRFAPRRPFLLLRSERVPPPACTRAGSRRSWFSGWGGSPAPVPRHGGPIRGGPILLRCSDANGRINISFLVRRAWPTRERATVPWIRIDGGERFLPLPGTPGDGCARLPPIWSTRKGTAVTRSATM